MQEGRGVGVTLRGGFPHSGKWEAWKARAALRRSYNYFIFKFSFTFNERSSFNELKGIIQTEICISRKNFTRAYEGLYATGLSKACTTAKERKRARISSKVCRRAKQRMQHT